MKCTQLGGQRLFFKLKNIGMGDMGFLGLAYPEAYGGMDLDYFYDVVFNEELGRINSGGFQIAQQVTQYMAGPYVLKYGSKYLKDKYLPGIISGEKLCSIGIIEPGAGSDAQNIQTKAIREGDHYIVNGSKRCRWWLNYLLHRRAWFIQSTLPCLLRKRAQKVQSSQKRFYSFTS